jgi:hypothetical protein
MVLASLRVVLLAIESDLVTATAGVLDMHTTRVRIASGPQTSSFFHTSRGEAYTKQHCFDTTHRISWKVKKD